MVCKHNACDTGAATASVLDAGSMQCLAWNRSVARKTLPVGNSICVRTTQLQAFEYTLSLGIYIMR